MENVVQNTTNSANLPREIKILQIGPLWIAVPIESGPTLSEATVERVRRDIRKPEE
jgi:hypothetical protein